MTHSRFIAGAVCPVCGVMDRIAIETSSTSMARICVGCNYHDTLPFDSNETVPSPTNDEARTSASNPRTSRDDSERIAVRKSD
jgi:uncharacterized metal-binding protein (TIGR02443 family)